MPIGKIAGASVTRASVDCGRILAGIADVRISGVRLHGASFA